MFAARLGRDDLTVTAGQGRLSITGRVVATDDHMATVAVRGLLDYADPDRADQYEISVRGTP